MPEPIEFSRWRPHPWHGLDPGPEVPRLVRAYIEITPFDLVKYEIDKPSGYLKVDRPQGSSSLPPTLYGIVPRTYCGARVGALASVVVGDGDPLDICVVSERPITRAEVILTARPVGGFATIDSGKADDKIIAVLANDELWKDVEDVAGLPPVLVRRLEHYFRTYKLLPGESAPVIEMRGTYGHEHAWRVIEASRQDYEAVFGGR